MDAEHMIELELALQRQPTRSDPEAVAALLSHEFREFGASGRVWTRDEILAELTAEGTAPAITSTGFVCQFLAPELALLTYESSRGTRHALRSSLWRCEGGIWRLLFHQGTPIP